MTKLSKNHAVQEIARELGLRGDDATDAVIRHCCSLVSRTLREHRCRTLEDLLGLVAVQLGTHFEEVRTDKELDDLARRYVAQGEKCFMGLRHEFDAKRVFGITYRLQHADECDSPFVSVIDMRSSESAARSYFTKWHEIAHLLSTTDEQRATFRRSHSGPKDPTEELMDRIAGRVGFLPELINPHCRGDISFDAIERVRAAVCPTASFLAAARGIAEAWPTPVMIVEATAKTAVSGDSTSLALRATHFTVNAAAKAARLRMIWNMRVPNSSIVAKSFSSGVEMNGYEDLATWTTSDGRALTKARLRVEARRHGTMVLALFAAPGASKAAAA